jgi:hypothetical protein
MVRGGDVMNNARRELRERVPKRRTSLRKTTRKIRKSRMVRLKIKATRKKAPMRAPKISRKAVGSGGDESDPVEPVERDDSDGRAARRIAGHVDGARHCHGDCH